ncbi:unnamed protein product [Symbiodinium sp. CCMP2592]|nr:unnamed protein product [Symbiodinium sp. CCMP2592]
MRSGKLVPSGSTDAISFHCCHSDADTLLKGPAESSGTMRSAAAVAGEGQRQQQAKGARKRLHSASLEATETGRRVASLGSSAHRKDRKDAQSPSSPLGSGPPRSSPADSADRLGLLQAVMRGVWSVSGSSEGHCTRDVGSSPHDKIREGSCAATARFPAVNFRRCGA